MFLISHLILVLRSSFFHSKSSVRRQANLTKMSLRSAHKLFNIYQAPYMHSVVRRASNSTSFSVYPVSADIGPLLQTGSVSNDLLFSSAATVRRSWLRTSKVSSIKLSAISPHCGPSISPPRAFSTKWLPTSPRCGARMKISGLACSGRTIILLQCA